MIANTLIQRTRRRSICSLLTFVVALTSVLVPIAHAQTSALDLTPPVIEFEPMERGAPGEVQEFVTNITEDGALLTVILYHRFSGDELYASTEMLNVKGSSSFTGSVVTDINDVKDIEYYIQAEDGEGNRAIRGFSFDPLVLKMGDDPAAAIATTAAATSPVASENAGGNAKWMWGLLGVLVVVAAAGAAGAGGSDTGQTGSPPTNVTLEIQELN